MPIPSGSGSAPPATTGPPSPARLSPQPRIVIDSARAPTRFVGISRRPASRKLNPKGEERLASRIRRGERRRGRRPAGFCQEQTDNFLNTRDILRASAKLWLLRDWLRIPAHPVILIFGLFTRAERLCTQHPSRFPDSFLVVAPDAQRRAAVSPSRNHWKRRRGHR